MAEPGYSSASNDENFENGHRVPPTNPQRNRVNTKLVRIYISGDTLMVSELREIPEHYEGQNVDLTLIHLGGITTPSPSVPLLMVTMDAKQGIVLVQLIQPDVTIPIHYE